MGKKIIVKGANFTVNNVGNDGPYTYSDPDIYVLDTTRSSSTLYSAGSVKYANLSATTVPASATDGVDYTGCILSSSSNDTAPAVLAAQAASGITDYIDVSHYNLMDITGSCTAGSSGIFAFVMFYDESKVAIGGGIGITTSSTISVGGLYTELLSEAFAGTKENIAIPSGAKYVRCGISTKKGTAEKFEIYLH